MNETGAEVTHYRHFKWREGHCALGDVLGVFLIEGTFTAHKILKLTTSKTFKQHYYVLTCTAMSTVTCLVSYK